ncbi:leucyl/phenylalanyl-tRNA--protein transferase [Octadecabacter sp. R77987]|uniref:leucyl/phenylalanyl-tRNA--protein transferase n=1 Tax=Octadecabacter sp. R77987 TaxID=3093874 RepID=UPI00366C30F4
MMTPALLLNAYANGIFPMAEHQDDTEVFWVDPRQRGVFPLDGFHISRSLARAIRRADYTVSVDADFSGVVAACADRPTTWINRELLGLYDQLHAMGHAHSLEVRDMDGALIGGVFGLVIGAGFFGESMFSRRVNGSKIALAYLVDRLLRAGFTLFDTQFTTPHLTSLGAVEIPRAQYHAQLAQAIDLQADFLGPAVPPPQDVLQRNAQTS